MLHSLHAVWWIRLASDSAHCSVIWWMKLSSISNVIECESSCGENLVLHQLRCWKDGCNTEIYIYIGIFEVFRAIATESEFHAAD